MLMNDDLMKFRLILEARVAELERGITQRDAIAVEPTPEAGEEVQRASERALAVSNIDRESKLLKNARAALRRIHDRTFGVCEECEEQISLKRLAAIPWVSLCVICQEAREAGLASASIEQLYAA